MAINLRNEAKGRECQIRIPGVCNSNSETVVLCHLNSKRLFSVGTGQKVPDIFGAHGCSACHDVVDGRRKWTYKDSWIDDREIEKMFHEGVFRTQNLLLKEGKIGRIK